ncbi:hypothetical protein RhiirA5_404711 [Rhizophagus irregularis]|uniref:Uncharacterized protein n=1 Tax=Rhizophagus irregularis TaxID=588596 RepID=A0A2I1EP09_9GLOM|nr:hypothetical protein RhiirA5_404711 [Rhizophagus irregularis]PKY23871.1 hypothetical protein RhiirB3_471693 [Rhizophagus irregularis]
MSDLYCFLSFYQNKRFHVFIPKGSQQAPEEFSSLNHRSKNAEIDRLWNVVERESLEIEHVKETKQLQLDQLKIARVMTKGTEDGGGNIMKNVNTELVESATYLKRRRDVDYKEDRDGYTTPCPN